MKHVITVLCENRAGVLSHVAGLFSSRGFNIDSLAVGETHDPSVSRMTIVTEADERILEQIIKQLRKLIDVIKVQDLTGEDFIDRELILIKVEAEPAKRHEVIEIANIFRAQIVDVGKNTLGIQASGRQSKIKALIELLSEFGIKEIVRTGRIAMRRS
jgi:acetolactate synthase I/III small subunit